MAWQETVITLAFELASHADKRIVDYERARASTLYAEGEEPVGKRDGKKCGRKKLGRTQCGLRVAVVLSIREKSAGRRNRAEQKYAGRDGLTVQ